MRRAQAKEFSGKRVLLTSEDTPRAVGRRGGGRCTRAVPRHTTRARAAYPGACGIGAEEGSGEEKTTAEEVAGVGGSKSDPARPCATSRGGTDDPARRRSGREAGSRGVGGRPGPSRRRGSPTPLRLLRDSHAGRHSTGTDEAFVIGRLSGNGSFGNQGPSGNENDLPGYYGNLSSMFCKNGRSLL